MDENLVCGLTRFSSPPAPLSAGLLILMRSRSRVQTAKRLCQKRERRCLLSAKYGSHVQISCPRMRLPESSCRSSPMAIDQTIQPPAAPGRGSQVDENLVIRESVDSLCRDGADTPIVRVHRKAFLTRERSRSKPFWTTSQWFSTQQYPPSS